MTGARRAGPGWIVAVLLSTALAADGAGAADGAIEIRTSSRLKHVPGTWSSLDVLATNPTATDGEALIVVSFPGGDGRQFARRVWVPARSERITWLPVRIPAEVPGGATTLPMTVMALDAAAEGDILSRPDAGAGFVSDDLLRVSNEPIRSATYLDRQVLDDAEDVSARNDEWIKTVAAARTSVQLSSVVSDLADDFLAPWPVTLRGLDQILVASDRIAYDSVGAASLRGWVRDGGRLWVALDSIRPETLTHLLGDDARIETVDRVQLDDFVIDGIGDEGAAVVDRCEHDRPVDFVRVVTSHPDVVARIGDWPAAIVVPYGQGEVLLTTLAARGWLTPEGQQPTANLRALAGRILRLRAGRLDPGRLPRELERRIGATVPPRRSAAWVLGGFCALLVAATVALAARGWLAGLGAVVPVAGAVAAAAMLGVAGAGSRSVPPQIASAEVVRVAPRTAESLADGLAAVYDSGSRPVEWRGEERHWTVPRPQRGTPAGRLLFRDDGTLEVGQTTTHARSIDRVALAGGDALRGAVARGRFSGAGLVGRLAVDGHPPAADGGDPFVVVSPSPALAVRLAADGTFTAAAEDVMAADQYAAAGLLSEESMWRQEAVRTLLAIPGGAVEDGDRPAPRVDPEADPPPLQGRPWLCYWSTPESDPWGLPEPFTRRRAVFVVAELALDRTRSGERFRIPAPFLRATVVEGQAGRSAAFDVRTGRWIRGLSRPSETMLRFQLPPEIVPCRIEGGRLDVRASAPARTLSVSAVGAGTESAVQRVANPEGLHVFTFDAADLRPDDRWGLTFRVAIGEAARDARPGDEDVELTETWQIDHVHLSLDGIAD